MSFKSLKAEKTFRSIMAFVLAFSIITGIIAPSFDAFASEGEGTEYVETENNGNTSSEDGADGEKGGAGDVTEPNEGETGTEPTEGEGEGEPGTEPTEGEGEGEPGTEPTEGEGEGEPGTEPTEGEGEPGTEPTEGEGEGEVIGGLKEGMRGDESSTVKPIKFEISKVEDTEEGIPLETGKSQSTGVLVSASGVDAAILAFRVSDGKISNVSDNNKVTATTFIPECSGASKLIQLEKIFTAEELGLASQPGVNADDRFTVVIAPREANKASYMYTFTMKYLFPAGVTPAGETQRVNAFALPGVETSGGIGNSGYTLDTNKTEYIVESDIDVVLTSVASADHGVGTTIYSVKDGGVTVSSTFDALKEENYDVVEGWRPTDGVYPENGKYTVQYNVSVFTQNRGSSADYGFINIKEGAKIEFKLGGYLGAGKPQFLVKDSTNTTVEHTTSGDGTIYIPLSSGKDVVASYQVFVTYNKLDYTNEYKCNEKLTEPQKITASTKLIYTPVTEGAVRNETCEDLVNSFGYKQKEYTIPTLVIDRSYTLVNGTKLLYNLANRTLYEGGVVEYSLYKGETATGTAIKTMEIGNDGIANFGPLEAGCYVLVETKTAGAGFTEHDPVYIKVETDMTTGKSTLWVSKTGFDLAGEFMTGKRVNLVTEMSGRTSITVYVKKQAEWSESMSLLKNEEDIISVYKNNEFWKTYSTDAAGKAIIHNVIVDGTTTYRIEGAKTFENYYTPKENLVLQGEGAKSEYTLEYKIKGGSFSMGKVFLNPLNSAQSEPNFEATFGLYKDGASTPAYTFIITGNGSASKTLIKQYFAAGTYTIKETEIKINKEDAKDKYPLYTGNDVKVTIVDGKFDGTVENLNGANIIDASGRFQNKSAEGQLIIQGFNAKGGSATGFTYVIKNASGDVVDTVKASANPVSVFLKAGTYTVTPEDRDGYDILARSASDYKVTISKATPAVNNFTVTVDETSKKPSITNKEGTSSSQTVAFVFGKRPNISLTKRDSVSNANITGAEFTLYKLNDAGNSYQKTAYVVTSASNGAASFIGVERGKYLLVETVVPGGYMVPGYYNTFKNGDVFKDNVSKDNVEHLGSKPQSMTVGYGDYDTNMSYGVVKNVKKPAIVIKTVAADDGVTLSDAEYQYYKVSEKDGKEQLTKCSESALLPGGTYCVEQKKAPNGYSKRSEKAYFKIDDNGSFDTMTTENEPFKSISRSAISASNSTLTITFSNTKFYTPIIYKWAERAEYFLDGGGEGNTNELQYGVPVAGTTFNFRLSYKEKDKERQYAADKDAYTFTPDKSKAWKFTSTHLDNGKINLPSLNHELSEEWLLEETSRVEVKKQVINGTIVTGTESLDPKQFYEKAKWKIVLTRTEADKKNNTSRGVTIYKGDDKKPLEKKGSADYIYNDIDAYFIDISKYILYAYDKDGKLLINATPAMTPNNINKLEIASPDQLVEDAVFRIYRWSDENGTYLSGWTNPGTNQPLDGIDLKDYEANHVQVLYISGKGESVNTAHSKALPSGQYLIVEGRAPLETWPSGRSESYLYETTDPLKSDDDPDIHKKANWNPTGGIVMLNGEAYYARIVEIGVQKLDKDGNPVKDDKGREILPSKHTNLKLGNVDLSGYIRWGNGVRLYAAKHGFTIQADGSLVQEKAALIDVEFAVYLASRSKNAEGVGEGEFVRFDTAGNIGDAAKPYTEEAKSGTYKDPNNGTFVTAGFSMQSALDWMVTALAKERDINLSSCSDAEKIKLYEEAAGYEYAYIVQETRMFGEEIDEEGNLKKKSDYTESFGWVQEIQGVPENVRLLRPQYVFEIPYTFCVAKIKDLKGSQIKGERIEGYFGENEANASPTTSASIAGAGPLADQIASITLNKLQGDHNVQFGTVSSQIPVVLANVKGKVSIGITKYDAVTKNVIANKTGDQDGENAKFDVYHSFESTYNAENVHRVKENVNAASVVSTFLPGYYYVVEKKAPTGYNLFGTYSIGTKTAAFDMTVENAPPMGAITASSGTIKVNVFDVPYAKISIQNTWKSKTSTENSSSYTLACTDAGTTFAAQTFNVEGIAKVTISNLTDGSYKIIENATFKGSETANASEYIPNAKVKSPGITFVVVKGMVQNIEIDGKAVAVADGVTVADSGTNANTVVTVNHLLGGALKVQKRYINEIGTKVTSSTGVTEAVFTVEGIDPARAAQEFTLSYSSTVKSGIIPLEKGTYKVTEKSTSAGYLIDSTPVYVTIGEDGIVYLQNATDVLGTQETPLNKTNSGETSAGGDPAKYFYNKLDKANFYIYKIDPAKGTTNLTGAQFEIYTKSGVNEYTKVEGVTVKAGSGYYSVQLSGGTYYVKETVAPAGYQLLDGYTEIKVTPNEKPVLGGVNTVTIVNAPFISLTAHKHTSYKGMEDTAEGVVPVDKTYHVAGVTMTLYKKNAEGVFAVVGTPKNTNAAGKATFTSIGIGEYRIVESLGASAPKYLSLSETFGDISTSPSIVVTYDVTSQKLVASSTDTANFSAETNTMEIYNAFNGARVAVKKVDYNDGKALPGAVFQLWSKDPYSAEATTKDILETKTTDSNGYINFSPSVVQAGAQLWIREVTPPAGYAIDESYEARVKRIEVKASDIGGLIEVQFKNVVLPEPPEAGIGKTVEQDSVHAPLNKSGFTLDYTIDLSKGSEDGLGNNRPIYDYTLEDAGPKFWSSLKTNESNEPVWSNGKPVVDGQLQGNTINWFVSKITFTGVSSNLKLNDDTSKVSGFVRINGGAWQKLNDGEETNITGEFKNLKIEYASGKLDASGNLVAPSESVVMYNFNPGEVKLTVQVLRSDAGIANKEPVAVTNVATVTGMFGGATKISETTNTVLTRIPTVSRPTVEVEKRLADSMLIDVEEGETVGKIKDVAPGDKVDYVLTLKNTSKDITQGDMVSPIIVDVMQKNAMSITDELVVGKDGKEIPQIQFTSPIEGRANAMQEYLKTHEVTPEIYNGNIVFWDFEGFELKYGEEIKITIRTELASFIIEDDVENHVYVTSSQALSPSAEHKEGASFEGTLVNANVPGVYTNKRITSGDLFDQMNKALGVLASYGLYLEHPGTSLTLTRASSLSPMRYIGKDGEDWNSSAEPMVFYPGESVYYRLLVANKIEKPAEGDTPSAKNFIVHEWFPASGDPYLVGDSRLRGTEWTQALTDMWHATFKLKNVKAYIFSVDEETGEVTPGSRKELKDGVDGVKFVVEPVYDGKNFIVNVDDDSEVVLPDVSTRSFMTRETQKKIIGFRAYIIGVQVANLEAIEVIYHMDMPDWDAEGAKDVYLDNIRKNAVGAFLPAFHYVTGEREQTYVDNLETNPVVATILAPSVVITGTVWNDANRNGIMDNDSQGNPEGPVLDGNAPITVELWQKKAGASWKRIKVTETDANGQYRFEDIESSYGTNPPEYKIRVENVSPTTMRFTDTKDDPENETLSNNVDYSETNNGDNYMKTHMRHAVDGSDGVIWETNVFKPMDGGGVVNAALYTLEKVNVYYKPGTSSKVTDMPENLLEQSEEDKIIIQDIEPQRPGFTFEGWRVESDPSNSLDKKKVWMPGDEFIMPANDVVFVAKWLSNGGGHGETKPGNVILEALKTLDGKAPGDARFSFKVYDDQDRFVAAGTNDSEGKVTFDAFEIDEAGTFKFTMVEVVKSNTDISYDETVHTVVVKTHMDENGITIVVDSITYDGGTQVPVFANKTVSKTADVTVRKLWRGPEGTMIPKSIKVQLVCNGEDFGTPVVIGESNNWSYVWSNLDASKKWSVYEIDVPEGFVCKVTGEGNKFVITNTLEGEQPPVDPEDPDWIEIPDVDPPLIDIPTDETPKTGSRFVSVMGLMSALAAAGIFMLRKRKPEEA